MIEITEKMPVLFIGHGSPMNAIEDNNYTKGWEELSCRIPKPKAILVISAHWYTDGVLILGSGNVVHNLSKIDWEMNEGYSWAIEFDDYIKSNIINKEYNNVIHYEQAGQSSKLAFYTQDHFYPLLYVLGASRKDDKLTIFNNSCLLGSLSMTSYLFE